MLQVSSSTIAAPALDAVLRSAYALQDSHCRLLRAGINHTYLAVAGEERFVLRIYSFNWRSAEEILEELRLLHLLRADGLPVSYPIADRRGDWLQHFEAPEGIRHAVLFSYAPGQKIIESGPALHREAGLLMAGMHLAAAGVQLRRPQHSFDSLVTQPLRRLKAFLPADCSELLQLNELLHRIRPQLEQSLGMLPRGVVHLDIWFDNLNIDTNGRITLFDFDFCGNGVLALDPAYYLMQLHFISPDRYDEHAAAFLEGYEACRPLAEAERTALAGLGIALYCFYLGVQCERFEDYSSVFVSEMYLKRYIAARILRYAAFRGL